VRVSEEVALGSACVSIRCEGWPQGEVAPSRHQIPVVARKALPSITVSPELQREWAVDGYAIQQISFTVDGGTLWGIVSRKVNGERLYQFRLWDAATGKERLKFFQMDPEESISTWGPFVCESPDGRHLAVMSHSERYLREGKKVKTTKSSDVRLFDLSTGQLCWKREISGLEGGYAAAFSPDGLSFVTGHTREIERLRDYEGAVYRWDVRTGEKTVLPTGRLHIVISLAYSPDGKYLLIGEFQRGDKEEKRLRLWNESASKEEGVFSGRYSGAFSPDSARLAGYAYRHVAAGEAKSGRDEYPGDVKVWDLKTGKEQAALSLDHDRGTLTQLVWLPNGRELLLPTSFGRLTRWSVAGGMPTVAVESLTLKPTDKYTRHPASCQVANMKAGLYAIAVNGALPERVAGLRLADDYDELPPPRIVVWDGHSMQRRATLTGHRGVVNTLAFSPDGKTIASGGSDGAIRIWNLDKGANAAK
jgi:WD40 repeat protein